MTCQDCNQDKPDAMMRTLEQLKRDGKDATKNLDRVLCTECCAKYPGREWMRRDD